MNEDDALMIYNDDIESLYNRINRVIFELQKSASANVTDINEHDRRRITAFVNYVSTFVDYVEKKKYLDWPETHPIQITLDKSPEIQKVENLLIRDLVKKLVRLRNEIINSQSARNSNGIISHDMDRLKAGIQAIRAFLIEYADKVVPVDMPESSPSVPTSGEGNTGV